MTLMKLKQMYFEKYHKPFECQEDNCDILLDLIQDFMDEITIDRITYEFVSEQTLEISMFTDDMVLEHGRQSVFYTIIRFASAFRFYKVKDDVLCLKLSFHSEG